MVAQTKRSKGEYTRRGRPEKNNKQTRSRKTKKVNKSIKTENNTLRKKILRYTDAVCNARDQMKAIRKEKEESDKHVNEIETEYNEEMEIKDDKIKRMEHRSRIQAKHIVDLEEQIKKLKMKINVRGANGKTRGQR